MTRQEITAAAEERTEMILDQIEAFGGRVDLIPLSNYVDEQTYDFLLINPGWKFDEWRIVNHAVAAMLAEEGFIVQLVDLKMDAFFEFLVRYNLSNTPANRAQYIGWAIAPEPKPVPKPD